MDVQCELCPKNCVVAPGQSGDCRIRVNLDGQLKAVVYGYPSAVHVDPIEKKPLNHFLPGTNIFSLATVGCNLHCKNCQNWDLSQRNPEDAAAMRLPPKAIPVAAERYDCPSVAYTYSEPLAYYEYTLDSCIKVREAGRYNVLVTAGYVNEKPLRELCKYVDAANIDLKAFSDKFYREVCAGTLKPVLNTLVVAKTMGVIVEVTNLLIPTLNDSDNDIKALCTWMKENLGSETPIHFSRFVPHYRLRNLPPTPAETLVRARDIARAAGLHHIYIGNILIQDSSNTLCPSCDKVLVYRRGYQILNNFIHKGRCPSCNTEIYGRWK